MVPYWCMCRMAASAYAPTGMGSPYGCFELRGELGRARAFRLRLVRWVLAVGDQGHVDQAGLDGRGGVARVRLEGRPPMLVLSVYRGWMPRYSARVMVGAQLHGTA